MKELVFSVGISSRKVMRHLRESPILSIVGFQNCGKSTLAETLAEDLEKSGYNTLLQNARSWTQQHQGTPAKNTSTSASVDPEIISAIARFRKSKCLGCWIVDDAEVMFAYATDEILANLGQELAQGNFALVLLRNRFVFENEGWFFQRQTLIAPKIESWIMKPLQLDYASKVATSMFRGHSTAWQGQWLASMSGGIPGLMNDLHRYTPRWPTDEPPARLLRFAGLKRNKLLLNKPTRQTLVEAVARRALPPPMFLSDQAKAELGALTLAGMISGQYPMSKSPFNGKFWSLVAGPAKNTEPFPEILSDTAINLVILIQHAGLIELFTKEYKTPDNTTSSLSQNFANVLFCEQMNPHLVTPLRAFFIDNIGRSGLSRILESQGVKRDPSVSPPLLFNKLLELARTP